METIISYIDNLFRTYPDTPQVRRAKEELLGIMEDKYHELKNEGKSENEAIGIVISEFGSMDEIDFGFELHETKDSAETAEAQIPLTLDQALNYINNQKNFGIKIGIGVVFCILSPSLAIIMEMLHEGRFIPENASESIGAIGLFGMVAIAVGIFIIEGYGQSKYEQYKTKKILLDPVSKSQITQRAEAYHQIFGAKIAIGVIICIISVIPAVILEAVFEDTPLEWINELSGLFVFSFVAAGVYLFVSASILQHAFHTLLGKNPTVIAKKNKKNKKIGIIASIYWPVITAIYLGLSFITMDWGRTWFIWPIAGILFGGISSVISLVYGEK